MIVRIQHWGSSLAIRIPKAFAEQANLHANDEIEIMLRDGEIVLRPHKIPTYSLDELLESITSENRPGEWNIGPAAGNEIW